MFCVYCSLHSTRNAQIGAISDVLVYNFNRILIS